MRQDGGQLARAEVPQPHGTILAGSAGMGGSGNQQEIQQHRCWCKDTGPKQSMQRTTDPDTIVSLTIALQSTLSSCPARQLKLAVPTQCQTETKPIAWCQTATSALPRMVCDISRGRAWTALRSKITTVGRTAARSALGLQCQREAKDETEAWNTYFSARRVFWNFGSGDDESKKRQLQSKDER